jgi:hypothetical protein
VVLQSDNTAIFARGFVGVNSRVLGARTFRYNSADLQSGLRCSEFEMMGIQVKEAAHTIVASNDNGGIAEAIERFIL